MLIPVPLSILQELSAVEPAWQDLPRPIDPSIERFERPLLSIYKPSHEQPAPRA
jgi:hypothetical protein